MRKEMNAIALAAQHKLEKVMLHKNSDDDVLITYGRGAVPARLEKSRLKNLTDADWNYFLSFYRPAPDATHSRRPGQLSETADDTVFYLRSIPGFISREAAGAISEKTACTCLHTHYREIADGFLLHSQFVSEIDEVCLARVFGAPENWIEDADRVSLAAWIKITFPDITVPDVYYCTFYNDLRNYFFYRKHHEHVPGTMLIEAARQGYYAQFYTTTEVKPGEVSISMDALKADFREYTNPNYPVRIMVDDADPNLPWNNQRQIHKRATFQQDGRIVGVIEMQGQVMKIRQFKRMRNIRANEAHRFTPVKNISRWILLEDDQGRKYECVLNNLSSRGFGVALGAGCAASPGQRFDCTFFVEGLGLIEGRAELTTHQENEGDTVELLITEISDESESKLREVIKNYTHVVTAREVF
jgi:hypothetical protein